MKYRTEILVGLTTLFFIVLLNFLSSCGYRKYRPDNFNNGHVVGVAPGRVFNSIRLSGMVVIPQGVFHMGSSDEDPAAAFANRNKTISIRGFWMDATEITNNEYRQFVNWVRDSVTAVKLGFLTDKFGETRIDWKKIKEFNWNKSLDLVEQAGLLLPVDERVFNKRELDVQNFVYYSEKFDLKEAAKRENTGRRRSDFIMIKKIKIYPDTLVWIRDFSYSYNEPMTKRYFSHPAYGNYPVVGVTWNQATAFCEWRTHYFESYLQSKRIDPQGDFRLPTEAEWEYAARGGRSQSMFPWGNYYLRNKKGCLMANFKPGRGNYPEDGGFYTVRADSYWPNDYGLYCMSGNVAEWTSSLYTEAPMPFIHDMNPDIRYNARLADPPYMKRKTIRGGSWKDVGYYLQTGTRAHEYLDSAKSYIGFRCVVDYFK
jgi:gliding motility-associated lipoprotein GldK